MHTKLFTCFFLILCFSLKTYQSLQFQLFFVCYCKRISTSASLMSFYCIHYRAVCFEDLTFICISISLVHTRVMYRCLLARSHVSFLASYDPNILIILTCFYPHFNNLVLLCAIYNYFEMNWLSLVSYINVYTIIVTCIRNA